MIERKVLKVFAIVVIIIATYKFIEIIHKQEEFDIRSLPLFPPNRNESKQPLVFLHIGKSGGTSINEVMRRVAKDLGRKFVGTECGKCHFDWSYIDKRFGPDANVLTIFRHPIDRAISHFNYAKRYCLYDKRLCWTEERKNRVQTMEQYLNDIELMHKTRTIWMDGQAGVMWLSGLHVDNWVQIPPSEKE